MRRRYLWIDNLRAFALVSMIVYHAVWDIVFLYGKYWKWFEGTAALLWERSICVTFLVVAGFCSSFCRKPFGQGLLLSGAGFLVTAVTGLFSPESQVIFGVLNLIGAAVLLQILLKKYLEKLPAGWGVWLMFLMFAVTYPVNEGFLGFFGRKVVRLPEIFYANPGTAFLGFPDQDFVSSDYFSLIPWSFLYFLGYFLYRIWDAHGRAGFTLADRRIPVLTWMGQHSLQVYLIHQPLLYGFFEIVLK